MLDATRDVVRRHTIIGNEGTGENEENVVL